MRRVLNLKVGTRSLTVVVAGVSMKEVPDKTGLVIPKIFLDVRDAGGLEYRLDEAWISDAGGKPKLSGMWLKLDSAGLIRGSSTLARVLMFYRAETLADLVGREIVLFPKQNGFLAVVAVNGVEDGALADAQKSTN